MSRVLVLVILAASLRSSSCDDSSTPKVFIVSSTSANESAYVKAAEPRVKQEFSPISVHSPTLIVRKKDDRSRVSSSSTAASTVTPNTRRIPAPRIRSHPSLKHSSRDTYLDALQYSHNIKEVPTNKIARREYTPGPVYRGEDNSNQIKESQPKISRISTGTSSSGYLPSIDDTYSPPHYSANDFAAGSYGPPPHHQHHNYGPPHHAYGTPQSGLGSISATYSTSHPLPDIFPLLFPPIDLSWPISLKLNAYTLIKIVLKIVIFKMIVKFIATVCLLLFIPKIIKHGKPGGGGNHDDEDDDDSRGFSAKPSEYKLHRLSTMIARSLEQFRDVSEKHRDDEEGAKSDNDCSSLGCQVRRSLFASSGDTWDDYARLFKSYAAEELQQQNSRKKRRR